MVMRLFMIGPSPYARKCLAAAVECGLRDELEPVLVNPHERPPELLAVNPLSKVPTLVADDGMVLYDSSAICLYFDHLTRRERLVPDAPERRWPVLRRHALTHGLMDAAVLRRVEGQHGDDPDRARTLAKQRAVCARVIAHCEANLDDFGSTTSDDHGATLDQLTLACALGYLDFRFPSDHWRDGHPRLTAWYQRFAARPALRLTVPHG